MPVWGWVLIGVAAFVIWLSRPYPCRATFESVRHGMTAAEVATVVGRPPGDYRTDDQSWLPPSSYFDGDWWLADDATLKVRFDDTGRATELIVEDPIRFGPRPGAFQRLQARLGFR